MSGSYNRKLYDNCQFQLKLRESVSPGEYKLYQGAYENELNSEYCAKNSNATISKVRSNTVDCVKLVLSF